MQVLTAERLGNLVTLYTEIDKPTPQLLAQALEAELQYTFQRSTQFNDRNSYDDFSGARMPFVSEPRALCERNSRGQIMAGSGLLPRIRRLLAPLGVTLKVVESTLTTEAYRECNRHKTYATDVSAMVRAFTFRPYQDDAIAAIMATTGGIIVGPTGMGKGTLIEMVSVLYPNAKIHVVVRGKDLVDNLVGRLSKLHSGVGAVVGGRCNIGRRITVISADSLGHSYYDSDILLVDEVDAAATASYLEHLVKYQYARCFGLTASWNCRMDKADAELEPIFGPVIFDLSYQLAEAAGLVTPIKVEWIDVDGHSPSISKHLVTRKRMCIWRNARRNSAFADKIATYPEDSQILVLVDTLEHALHLRQYLPDFALCYSSLTSAELESYRKRGLMAQDEAPLSAKARVRLRNDFANGVVRRAIATTVWSKGVDFTALNVLVRADASSSATRDIQWNRASRVDGVKEYGILVDCMDSFDDKFHRRALTRRSNYLSFGWEQVRVQPGRRASAAAV